MELYNIYVCESKRDHFKELLIYVAENSVTLDTFNTVRLQSIYRKILFVLQYLIIYSGPTFML